MSLIQGKHQLGIGEFATFRLVNMAIQYGDPGPLASIGPGLGHLLGGQQAAA
jgi:hypothetical protein